MVKCKFCTRIEGLLWEVRRRAKGKNGKGGHGMKNGGQDRRVGYDCPTIALNLLLVAAVRAKTSTWSGNAANSNLGCFRQAGSHHSGVFVAAHFLSNQRDASHLRQHLPGKVGCLVARRRTGKKDAEREPRHVEQSLVERAAAGTTSTTA